MCVGRFAGEQQHPQAHEGPKNMGNADGVLSFVVVMNLGGMFAVLARSVSTMKIVWNWRNHGSKS
jgi:hypothetical protein